LKKKEAANLQKVFRPTPRKTTAQPLKNSCAGNRQQLHRKTN